MRTMLAAIGLGLAACGALGQTESPTERDSRMEWFREARFGMFIHWGLYAIPAGEWEGRRVDGIGEWIMHSAKVQVKDYEPLKDRFNPVKFDADGWVRIAKNAGMKYIVITSKHHDGFALFDSKVSDWDVMATPFKRDVLKELAAACKLHGVRLCFYHSIMDWHHPDYLPRREWDQRPAEGADFDRYVAYLKAQLTELLTGYGPIGILWFDGEWEESWTHARGKDLDSFVRRFQPSIIINNRVDKGRSSMAGLNREGEWAGDYGTPEQEIPSRGIAGVDWESCMTMNDTWGFRKDDQNWKSSTELIRMLTETASKGGNFLLNVGPTAEGEIPRESVERLAAIGAWMRLNSEAVYATAAGPFRKLKWGRATTKGETLYLHVHEWPADGRLVVPGLLNDVRRAELLADGAAAGVAREGSSVVLSLPGRARHEAATVVRLELDGAPRVVDIPIEPREGGVIMLGADDADVTGARTERIDGVVNVGFWTDPAGSVRWEYTSEAGEYDVTMEVSTSAGGGGYRVEFGGQSFTGVLPDTGGWSKFQRVRIARARLDGGVKQLWVRAGDPIKTPVMNLRYVTMERVGR